MAKGLFDDLPSVGEARQSPAGGGLFDDIPDDPVSKIDFAPVATDWKAAKAMIDKLPEDQRNRARDRYADLVVGGEREKGGVGQLVDDYVRRAASSVPGVGAWADEGNAWLTSLFGGDYDMAHAYQRAKDRAIDATETTKLGSIPIIGDVTTGGLTKAAGVVAGAAAMPFARVLPGAGAAPTAINVAGNAAAYGALDRAGNADEGSRLNAAQEGATTAAMIAAPLGAVMGKIASRGAPKATDGVAEAAAKVGVDLPRVAASGDSILERGTREAAAGLGAIPYVGTPLTRAAGKAIDQMDDAAVRIAGQYADDVTAQSAGETARRAISDWIKGGSSRVTEKLYDDVAKAIPASAFRPLTATRKIVDKLGAEDIASASSVNKQAIDMVAKALEVPGGLSFQGLLKLRTNVGAMIDDGLLPNAGTVKPALKQLYAGLSQDLSAMAWQFGGQRGVRAWTKANRVQDMIADRRETLAKIIGRDASKSGESLIDSIVRMAGTQSSGDAAKLQLARKAIGEAWDDVAAAVIPRLGRNQSNEFSPAVFLKKYSALSDAGRNVLFASTGKGSLKSELDALAVVADKFRNLDKLRNTSGTGRANIVSTALGFGAGFGMLVPMLQAAIPGAIMARIMAKPVKVKAVTDFSKALYDAASGKAGGLAQKAITQFAAAIAEESGEPADQVEARISNLLAGRQ